MFCVHFDARHWYVHCEHTNTLATDPGTEVERAVARGHTIDRIENLAIGRAGSALLDLGVVNLEELVEPCKKF